MPWTEITSPDEPVALLGEPSERARAGSLAHVVDDRTIALAERPGNRRADGYRNLLENLHVGLDFFIPGRGDTLRVNGRARLVPRRAVIAGEVEPCGMTVAQLDDHYAPERYAKGLYA